MLIGKQKNNFKVASITLVLAFMVIAEPVLAQDKRSDSGKSGGSSIKSEQARNGSTGFRFQRPLNVVKPPASIAPVTASSSPQISSSISKITGPSIFGRVAKSNINQPSSTMPSLQPNGPTLSRTPSLQRQSFFGTGRFSGGGMSTGVSSSIAGTTAVSSGNRTSLDKGPESASGGFSSTNQKSSFVITQREPAAASSTNRFRQSGTSQISSLFGIRSLSTANVVKRSTIEADNSASSDRTLRIGSLIGKKETSSPILEKSPAADQSKDITPDSIGGSRISSIRTSRLGSVIGGVRPSASGVREQPQASQSGRTSSDRIQHLGSLIGKEPTSAPIVKKLNRDDENPASRFHGDKFTPAKAGAGTSSPPKKQVQSISQTMQNHNSPQGRTDKIAETSRSKKDINLKSVDRLLPNSRPQKAVPDNQATITSSNVIGETNKGVARQAHHPEQSRMGDTHRHGLANPAFAGVTPFLRKQEFSPPHITGHTYPQAVRNIHHHEHVYWDCYNRLCHRIVWPSYCFAVHYGYGPHFTFRYVYPYHFRRYIFVSLGGYWPIDYRCIRYYWYGCHPYRWYGYYPIAYEVPGDTYNYYTYNYYYDDDGTVAYDSSQVVDGIRPVDHNTFADVREKLAQQKAESTGRLTAEPEPETLTDTCFDDGAKAFEAGDYNIAVEKFAEAMELAPDDMVVPFAYSQVLFATEQYCQAAEVLRAALAKVCPEKEGVFYPRGLYSDDDILFEQIEHLTKKAELFSFDADLQLLLGYQLLGIGEVDKAVEPLQRASQDFENAAAATTLLDLLAKISPASGGQGTDTK